MKDGVYIHYCLGWTLLEFRRDRGYPSYWIGKVGEYKSFASAKVGAQRRAIGLGLPYRGDCACTSCTSIPRNIWKELKHIVVE